MKQIIKNYSFNKNAKTVTFTDFATISLDRLLLVTNVSANVVIYQFNTPALGGTVAGTTGITATSWPTYAAALQQQAEWFQDQHNPGLELQIGNELELHQDGSLTAATLRANIRSLASA